MEREKGYAQLAIGPIGFLGIALCIGAEVGAYRTQENPMVVQFRQEYIDNDGCLADKLFDPSKGAKVSFRNVDGTEVLDVQSADNKTTLQFQESNEGLRFSSSATAAILARSGCELPDGDWVILTD